MSVCVKILYSSKYCWYSKGQFYKIILFFLLQEKSTVLIQTSFTFPDHCQPHFLPFHFPPSITVLTKEAQRLLQPIISAVETLLSFTFCLCSDFHASQLKPQGSLKLPEIGLVISKAALWLQRISSGPLLPRQMLMLDDMLGHLVPLFGGLFSDSVKTSLTRKEVLPISDT